MKIEDWRKRKVANEKISMLTCYDYTLAAVLNKTNIDAILVGDSSSMVMHGDKNTLGSDVDQFDRIGTKPMG